MFRLQRQEHGDWELGLGLVACHRRAEDVPGGDDDDDNDDSDDSDDDDASLKVMPGYFKNEKATKETLIDGWIHTGDIGYYDEVGGGILGPGSMSS